MKLEIDPCKAFTNLDKEDLIDLCGIIPFWLDLADRSTTDLISSLEDSYGMGRLGRIEGGEVKENGVFSYPHDTDLFPLMKISLQECVAYQYNYGIVAIVYNDDRETFVTRMD